jgi:hypothetical protein
MEDREVTEGWGVEWAPGVIEIWPTEVEARSRRDEGDPDALIVKIVEIREFYR